MALYMQNTGVEQHHFICNLPDRPSGLSIKTDNIGIKKIRCYEQGYRLTVALAGQGQSMRQRIDAGYV